MGEIPLVKRSIKAMAYRSGLFLIAVVSLLGVKTPMAKEMIWVTADGTASIAAGHLENARSQAIKNAERKAVGIALMPGVSVETLMVNLRLSGSILGAIPFGTVAEKSILEEGSVEAVGGESNPQEKLYRVKLKAGVVRETGGRDPSFDLDAALNQSVFKDGDALEIHIRSTKDCRLAIFNILEDKRIIRLLPNYLSRKNFIAADENFSFPGNAHRKKGVDLVVQLPKNKASVRESIFILALRPPFDLKPLDIQEGFYGAYDGQTAFMKDLIREVVGIPLKSGAEALIQYEIRKNKKGF